MKRRKSNPEMKISARKISLEEFAEKFRKLSDKEQSWTRVALSYLELFNKSLNNFLVNQANVIHLSSSVDYKKLKSIALNQPEQDYSEFEITEGHNEMNYIAGLDKMIHAADHLLEESVRTYKELLEFKEKSKNRQTRSFAKPIKIIKLFAVDPEERNQDLMELMIDKWTELIGQVSVYVLMLRQKRAVLEALRDNPENPEDEDPEQGLTPTQLFLGAY